MATDRLDQCLVCPVVTRTGPGPVRLSLRPGQVPAWSGWTSASHVKLDLFTFNAHICIPESMRTLE